ncbi:MAG: CDGSH iron-sulfur domain-containing protein [Bacteroidota bacterium]
MSTIIKIKSNGSIRIEGDFKIVDANDVEYNINGRTAISLCRCGLSKNKPFCDSSHKGIFMDDAVAFELPLPKKE